MTSTELVLIDDALKAVDVFKPGAVAKLISDLEAKVRAIPPADHTTEKGRNEIKALAYKVTRSKTALDKMGMDHVAELKKAAGVVDADRRIIRDRLDALKDEVRAPVTEYEAAEAGRIALHTHCMEVLQEIDTFDGEATIAEIDHRLECLQQLKTYNWEEFADGANRLIPKMDASLTAMRARIVQQEAERAELDRLRKAEAERQEAEGRAQAEQAQKARDALIADQARIAAEAASRKAIEAAEKATNDAKAATARAAERAEFEKAAAVEAEQRRVAQAKASEEAATKKREADKKHLAKINNKALADLIEAIPGLSERHAKLVIIAIASGKVANVKIEY